MNKRSKQFSFVNIGLSSLLVIFLVLCLTTFSLLSLSSAKSDYSQSSRLAEHRSDYYTTASEAERIVAEIDSVLEKTAGSYNSGVYSSVLSAELERISTEDVPLSLDTSSDGKMEITFSVPVNDRQALDAALRVNDPSSSDSYYEITKWQVTSTAERNTNDTVQLLPVK